MNILNISNKVLEKLPLPPGATFGPTINNEYKGEDMEWDGAGWYGLFRTPGTENFFWRKLCLSEEDLADIKKNPTDTLSDISRSFALSGYPEYITSL